MDYFDKNYNRHVAHDSNHAVHRRMFMKVLLGGMAGLVTPWSLAISNNNKLTGCFVINGWVIPKNMLSGK